MPRNRKNLFFGSKMGGGGLIRRIDLYMGKYGSHLSVVLFICYQLVVWDKLSLLPFFIIFC